MLGTGLWIKCLLIGCWMVSVTQGFLNTFRHIQVQTTIPVYRPIQNSKLRSQPEGSTVINRFEVVASNATAIEDECILTINDEKFNLTDWANAHPGGVAILRKFNGNNATTAFYAAGHSDTAIEMLDKFRIPSDTLDNVDISTQASATRRSRNGMQRWKQKLATREDPQWIHKSLGVYALLHFTYRMLKLLFTKDATAGFGSNLGKRTSLWCMIALVPHLLLSCSSLIFDTVPRERVVGKPMIWKENRWHSILFGTRSIVCSVFAWLSVRFGHAEPWRSILIACSCSCVLLTMIGADLTTHYLSPSKEESSVATLPFWEGCTVETQRRIKYFYAYSQFVATATCLLVANPAWPFSLLFPIQFASFLLTLCRKGLISAKAWHIGYAGSLILPFILAVRLMVYLRSFTFVTGLLSLSMILFQLRCRGINKYLLWIPVMLGRVFLGDRFIPYATW